MATGTQEQPHGRASEACANPASPEAAPATLQEVQREVQQLQDRLHDLEQRSGPAPTGGVYSDPDSPASTVQLQDVLPRIKDLAQAVGGMKELARIVNTLAEAKG